MENGRRSGSRIPRPEVKKSISGQGGGGGGQEGKLSSSHSGGSSGSGRGSSSSGGGSGSISKRVASLNLTVEEERVDGWPKWLIDNIPRDSLVGLVPRSADSYHKLDKVGQGTYSNVYKARNRKSGKIVALKKVRFDTSEPESVKFMAREITILRKLDHPNIVKLEGLATSRMQYSLYLVFEYMQSDLARIIFRPGERLTESQVKCYMHQLLSGLHHCHERGILHRDIKGSNLLIDKNGMLKIADFGLANYSDKHNLTNRVVTLWYRSPELILGATKYGIGIDLWSAGCLMAEMFAGRPIMPGRTEVEQLHRIFKLCGSPPEEYWKRLELSTTFRPPQEYKPSLGEIFRDFPESSLSLLKILLALDPAHRGTAGSALQNEFFYTSPLACDLSGLPAIYVEDDEPTQTNERRRHKNSKTRQRSPSQQRERPKKDPRGDSGSSKEGKTMELNSKATSSSSGGKRSQQQEEKPALRLISPEVPLLGKTSSSRTGGHPNDIINNIKNYRPPLPNPKTRTTNYSYYDDDDDTNMYRLGRVQRSASTYKRIPKS